MTIIVLLIVIAILLWLYSGFKHIQNDPPHVGLITFFGRRTNAVLGEGWRVVPWPFELIVEDITERDYDLVITVRTRDGAPVKISLKIHVVPNRARIVEWFNMGRDAGAQTKLMNICEEVARELAADVIDWATLQRSKNLDDAIIFRLTHHKRNELQGTTARFPVLDWPGMLLVNLEIGQIAIDPSSDAAKAADEKAREEARRRGEQEKLQARLERVQIIANIIKSASGRKLTADEMTRLTRQVIEDEQVDSGKAQKHVVEIPALSQGLAKLIESISGRRI